MKQQQKFPDLYRPEWTCGRYNQQHKVAIMYNLIGGQSYFFESHSATVIFEILSVPRNHILDLDQIASNTGIHIDSIVEFMDTLVETGLVITQPYSQETIREIQKQITFAHRTGLVNPEIVAQFAPYDTTSAEQAYADAISGPDTVSTTMFELTYNCSEKCIHCYNAGATRNNDETNNRARSEMNLDDYKRVIDELYELGLYKVCLTGGDPFSKSIAWDIIAYLYEKGIAFDIYTNGQTITNKVDQLLNYFPRFIGLSVYSASDEVHDKITRVKGSLQKTLSVAQQLSVYGVPMAFKCVIFKTNVKSYYTVAELAEQYGAIPQFEVNLCNGVDGDTSVINNLRLPVEILEIVLRDNRMPQYVDPELPNYGGYPKPLDATPCRAGISTFNITPEGELTPCCGFPASFGNVKNTSVSQILSSSDELKQWRKVEIKDIESCGRHDKCDFCMLCVGNGFIEHGTPLKPSAINCFMAEARYNLAQKLQAGNDPLNDLTIPKRLDQITIDEPISFKREVTSSYRSQKLTLK